MLAGREAGLFFPSKAVCIVFTYAAFSGDSPPDRQETDEPWLLSGQVNYLMTAGEGCFTSNLVELLAPAACNISNACNVSSLADALNYVDVTIFADDGKRTACHVHMFAWLLVSSASTARQGDSFLVCRITYVIHIG